MHKISSRGNICGDVDLKKQDADVSIRFVYQFRIRIRSKSSIIKYLYQIQLIKSSLEYKRPIEAPIKKGEVYGKLLIDIDGKPNIEVELIAQENVSTVNPISKIFAAMKYLIFGTSLDE